MYRQRIFTVKILIWEELFALKAVSVEDLKPGMVLARSLVNDDMIVVLSEGTELSKAHIIRLTFLNIPVVYIKDAYELSNNYQTATTIFNRGNAFVKDYGTVIGAAKEIFDGIGKGNEAPVTKAKEVVKGEVMPLTKSSGVIDYLFEMNHLAGDVYNHSLRVSIMSGVIAKWMHLDVAKTRDVVMAGFLHDIGKARFPQRLLEKNVDKLQGEDYDAYVQHTLDGNEILKNMPALSEGIKMGALQHHERMDGSGFPYGVYGGEIHEYARIVAVADLYDNMTIERVGYVKRTPFDAISYITDNLYTTLDPMVCVPFLIHTKDAFLGSRVILNDGQSGRIAAFPNDFAARPIVSLTEGELINLNEHPNIKITEYNPK